MRTQSACRAATKTAGVCFHCHSKRSSNENPCTWRSSNLREACSNPLSSSHRCYNHATMYKYYNQKGSLALLGTTLALAGCGVLYVLSMPRQCSTDTTQRTAKLSRSQPLGQIRQQVAEVVAPAPSSAAPVAATAAAPVPKHTTPLYNLAVNTPRVVATPVDFKGHKLNIVTLTNDEYVGSHIRNTKQPFQAYILSQLMDFIPAGSTVVDAGANLGLFSVFFAAQTGPSGTVYSFEPQARMYQLLCTNVIVNGLMNVRTQNKALSEKPGVLHMSAALPDGAAKGKSYDEVDASGAVMNYGGMRLGASGEEVQAVTLDSFNLTNVSLIKVDIQGAEKMMFFGAQDTIRRNLPVVSFEELVATPESDSSLFEKDIEKEIPVSEEVKNFNIKQFLTSLGYKVPPEMANWEDKIYLPPQHPYWKAAGLRRFRHLLDTATENGLVHSRQGLVK